nr:PREDICTED: uncharacterized protein LOC105678088 [Linepithema humile]
MTCDKLTFEMRPYLRFNNGYKYILTVIDVLILEYNNRKHRTISMRPIDVTLAIARETLVHGVQQKIAAPAKFKVGDPERISKFKTIFEKGYTSNWSTEKPLEGAFEREQVAGPFSQDALYRKLQLSFDLGHRRTYFTMNAAYASCYEAVFLCLHPKESKMSYRAAAKYMKVEDIYCKIIAVQRTNPVTYLIKDSRGNSVVGELYKHELLKTTQPDVYFVEKVLRRKDDEMFIKWLGFDSSHNSWINKDNVL